MADATTILSDVVIKELQEAAKGGIAKFKDVLMKKCDNWKDIPINIGITGISGVGKSTFINAIRGITADDEGGAHVDSVEATKDIKSYKHPSNENMIFWDLPGVGTPNFPRDTYLTDVQLERFDFFLIMSAGRFRENDLWLGKEVQNMNKNFHFVRTQIGLEIIKDKQAHPKTHKESTLLEKIRGDCLRNLGTYGFTNSSVFLIDSYSKLQFDFDHLATTFIDEAPEHKKEAITLTMSLLTKNVLAKKVEVLHGRILKVSLGSALSGAISGAVPIPGMGADIDVAVMLREIRFFKQQFGLDEKSMLENARLLHLETTELEKRLSLRSVEIADCSKDLVRSVSCLVPDEAFENALPIAIPIIDITISARGTYCATEYVLKHYLNVCFEDANTIFEELLRNALK